MMSQAEFTTTAAKYGYADPIALITSTRESLEARRDAVARTAAIETHSGGTKWAGHLALLNQALVFNAMIAAAK